MALRRACDPQHVPQPSVGTRTDYPQHRSLNDRICTVVSAPTDCVSGLGLPSRPSIRGTLQFPLWDRTYSRIGSYGGRYRRPLVSVSPGEAVAGVAAYVVIAVSVYAQHSTGYSPGHRLTSTGVWSSVHHGTAPAPGGSPPRPSHDTRTLDRGGVCAGVIPSRPHDVACP